MLPKKFLRPPLIVDGDDAFTDSLRTKSSQMNNIVFEYARLASDARAMLSDPKTGISSIFVNPKVVEWTEILKAAHSVRPGVPIFLIYDDSLPFPEADIKAAGIQGAFQKPLSYDRVIEIITPTLANFDVEAALAAQQKHRDEVNTELTEQDAQFTPIKADDFLSGKVSYFDLYVRIASGKYVKILQAGDNFSPERIASYLKNNVTHFFIRKDAQMHYINYCDKLASSMIRSTKVSAKAKTQQTLNHGEQTLKFLESNGFSQENMKLASSFIQNVDSLLRESELNKHGAISAFIDDVTAYEHGAGVAMIAGILTRNLRIGSFEPVEAIGLSALLHDIGLKYLNPPLTHEDEAKMTEAEKTAYRTHPSVGAAILSKVPRMKPIVIQAVEQHHERRNRKGFPARIGAGSISLVAEIVGLADEYMRILERKKTSLKFNLQFELEHNIYAAFSPPLVLEFKNAFGYK